jgi:hypothetical protein
MLFKKVTKEHLLKAIKDFEEKGLPNKFGISINKNFILNEEN